MRKPSKFNEGLRTIARLGEKPASQTARDVYGWLEGRGYQWAGAAWEIAPAAGPTPEQVSEHDFWVTLEGERGVELKRVLGTATLPVQSAYPVEVELIGAGKWPAFMLAIDALPPGQFDQIVEMLALRFESTSAEVRTQLEKQGLPIRFDYCEWRVAHTLPTP